MKLNNFWHNVPRNIPDPGGNPAPTPDPAPAPVPDPAANPAPVAADYSFIPADYVKDGVADTAAFSAHYQELVSAAAQRAEREAAIPETFAVSMPENLSFDGIEGLPSDFTVQLAADDPLMKPLFDGLSETLSKWAKEGLPATAGQELMGLLARYQATEYGQMTKQIEADMAKLGTPTQQTARISTIERALDTRLPADEATALKGLMQNSGAIKALERLLTPGRGTPPAPGTPPGLDTSNMTPAQKLVAANAQAR